MRRDPDDIGYGPGRHVLFGGCLAMFAAAIQPQWSRAVPFERANQS
jgi:hypothetical protein